MAMIKLNRGDVESKNGASITFLRHFLCPVSKERKAVKEEWNFPEFPKVLPSNTKSLCPVRPTRVDTITRHSSSFLLFVAAFGQVFAALTRRVWYLLSVIWCVNPPPFTTAQGSKMWTRTKIARPGIATLKAQTPTPKEYTPKNTKLSRSLLQRRKDPNKRATFKDRPESAHGSAAIREGQKRGAVLRSDWFGRWKKVWGFKK